MRLGAVTSPPQIKIGGFEILFRGQTKSKGEWVYGDLLHDEISNIAAIVSYVNLSGDVCDLSEISIYEVVPETVGRFTGLTDKNGKRIFKGDILKRCGTKQTIIYTVDWCEDCAMFVLPCITKSELETDFTVFNGEDFEIIGNIHDNPESRKIKMEVGNDETV